MSDTAKIAASGRNEWNVVAEFPLSTTQKRCWFLDLLTPGNRALHVSVRWEIRGTLQSKSLEKAFQTVIDRHEILRTRFVETDGTPVQQVTDGIAFRLAVIDIQKVPEEQRETFVQRIAAEQAAMPFDLTRPDLLRATLVQVEKQRAFLVFTVHQICFDGWSIRLLGREIGEVASAIEASRAPDLSDLPLQYGDYALWQEDYFAHSDFGAETDFWLKQLDGTRYFEVQGDHPRPAKRTTNVSLLSCDLSAEFGKRLEAEAQRNGMSPFSFGAGIVSAVLHRFTGENQVLFGTQIAGREDVDLEALIGVFINNLVLRFDFPSVLGIAEHLRRTNATIQASLTHQAMPFNRLVELVNPPRDPSRSPLIAINFILQKAFLEDIRYGDFELVSSPSRSAGAIYDLNFVMIGRPGGWKMTLEYNPDLFSNQTAATLLECWRATSELFVEHPDASLIDIPEPSPRLAPEDTPHKAKLLSLARTIESLDSVREAAVVNHSEDAREYKPYAFVSPATSVRLPLERLPTAIVEDLRGRLAAADMPIGVSILQNLPRLDSGELHLSELVVPPIEVPVARATDSENDEAIARLEKDLSRIWSEVLEIEEIPNDASFFSLGGHSLLTVRLAVKLKNQLGIEMDLATIYQAPTIAQLARRFARTGKFSQQVGSEEHDWRIIEVRSEGEGTPVIAINNSGTLYAISKHFDTPRRCLCVRLFDPSSNLDLPPKSFEAIATDYVALVKKAQPQGPYSLFGVCVHGNLALEVARQLMEGGDAVANVFMKDVWEPHYSHALARRKSVLLVNKYHDFKTRIRRFKRGELDLATFLSMYRIVRRTGLLALALKSGILKYPEGKQFTERQQDFVRYLTDARNEYFPQFYDGDVTMLLTSESPQGNLFDPSLGWKDIIGGNLKIVEVDDIVVYRDVEIGTDAVAGAIEATLAEFDGTVSPT